MIDLEKIFSDCDNEKNHHGQVLRKTYSGYQGWFDRYRKGDKRLDPNLKGMIENKLSEDEAFFSQNSPLQSGNIQFTDHL